jgi:nucleoside-diphosphate-sugar epimerase
MAEVIQFLEGQNIFVTGASGFLGKVLLEKFLQACPDVGKIFVLARPKKGKESSERVQNKRERLAQGLNTFCLGYVMERNENCSYRR